MLSNLVRPAECLACWEWGSPLLARDAASGVVRLAVTYGWHDVPFADMFRDLIELPVFLGEPQQGSAVGELHSGAGTGARSLLYVYAGRGIAAGVVLNGELYPGANSSAGELGHITVEPDGQLCECGSYGCLHTVASGEVLLRRARAAMKRADAAAGILMERFGGDPDRLTTLDLAEPRATAIHCRPPDEPRRAISGIGVGTLINLFNPDRVIVGGPMVGAGAPFVELLRSEARSRALAWPFGATQIVTSSLGADAGSVGAASLAHGMPPR